MQFFKTIFCFGKGTVDGGSGKEDRLALFKNTSVHEKITYKEGQNEKSKKPRKQYERCNSIARKESDSENPLDCKGYHEDPSMHGTILEISEVGEHVDDNGSIKEQNDIDGQTMHQQENIKIAEDEHFRGNLVRRNGVKRKGFDPKRIHFCTKCREQYRDLEDDNSHYMCISYDIDAASNTDEYEEGKEVISTAGYISLVQLSKLLFGNKSVH